jgi:hypothetical protein
MTCTIVLGFTSVCSIPVVSRMVFVRIANYTSTISRGEARRHYRYLSVGYLNFTTYS